MDIQVTRLTRAIGAVVHGVNLSDDLPDSSIERLRALLVEHQLLIFERQPITPQAQCRFAARFGQLHIHPIYPVLPELPEIMVIDTGVDFAPDNDNWHTDVTFSQHSAGPMILRTRPATNAP
jgi:taurine dioxygenase